MILQTWGAIRSKIQNDLDLSDSTDPNNFITDAELLGYANEAIQDAQSVVHTLGLETRYFLTTGFINLVVLQTDYALPADIFANKIVKMFYDSGSFSLLSNSTLKYEIFRNRDMREIPWIQVGEDYKYILLNYSKTNPDPNGGGTGVFIRFYPTPQVNETKTIQLYYIREANVLSSSTTDSTNVSEIPEAQNFIFQHMKKRCYEKGGDPRLPEAVTERQAQYNLMVQTLQEMVPDDNNQFVPDFTFYEDMYLDFGWRY